MNYYYYCGIKIYGFVQENGKSGSQENEFYRLLKAKLN